VDLALAKTGKLTVTQTDILVINNVNSRTYIYMFCKTDHCCYDKGKFMSVRYHCCEGISRSIISYNFRKKEISKSSIAV